MQQQKSKQLSHKVIGSSICFLKYQQNRPFERMFMRESYNKLNILIGCNCRSLSLQKMYFISYIEIGNNFFFRWFNQLAVIILSERNRISIIGVKLISNMKNPLHSFIAQTNKKKKNKINNQSYKTTIKLHL